MSRFEKIKEKVSEVAGTVEAHAEAVVEKTKAEFHEEKAKQALDRADKLDKDPNRMDELRSPLKRAPFRSGEAAPTLVPYL